MKTFIAILLLFAVNASAQTKHALPISGGGTGRSVPVSLDSVNSSKTLSASTDFGHLTIINSTAAVNDTLSAPTVAQNGLKWKFILVGAYADTLHSQTIGFNAKGSTGTITFTAAAGNNTELVAWDGNWYTSSGGTNATVH